jgi:tetratricopeptide (TPR) repeat protein
MSDQNKKVEPVRFEPAAGQSTPAAVASPARKLPTSGDGPDKWIVPALGGLLVLALLVFFWLPSQVSPDRISEEAANQQAASAASAAARPKPATEQAAPYADAQQARERKTAQDVLAELLEIQFALEEIGVEQWAADEFAAAQALAATADEQYRQQEFITATETYQQALDAMKAIQDSAEQVFQQQLEAGLAAIRSDQATPAVTALELAVLINPDSPEALAALERARNLEPLLEILAEANSSRAEGELESAIELLKQAVALDPEHPGAAAQLASVQRELAKRNFNRAMTAGYKALDGDYFDEAERQFKRAQAILPAATEPDSALVETRIARTQAQINAWRQRAEAAEAREDWNKAIAAYQEILNIDSTVVFARGGMTRSRTRAQIDQRIRQALENPARLSNDNIYRDTQVLYQQALNLDTKGPILKGQLTQLNDLLATARVPVPVLLQSDEQTDVTVYKVAHLGVFRRHQLSLNPGEYTAVGVRNGYRDVRKKFTVDHDQQSMVVEIACTEPI